VNTKTNENLGGMNPPKMPVLVFLESLLRQSRKIPSLLLGSRIFDPRIFAK
jgi:hypothetical protein